MANLAYVNLPSISQDVSRFDVLLNPYQMNRCKTSQIVHKIWFDLHYNFPEEQYAA